MTPLRFHESFSHRLGKILAFLLTGFTVCAVATAAVPAPSETLDVTKIDGLIQAEMEKEGSVGLSVAIMRNGQLLLAKGYGKSSIEADEPVTTNTIFAIGSVTKQFTCAAILLLSEEGKLSPSDKVAKFFPNLARATDITLLDLMGHTSGYPDYYPLDFVDRRMQRPIASDELIRQYSWGKLDFEPATRWSYSNTGYIILGRIVEIVSGESFAEFLKHRILQPARMAETVYEAAPSHPKLAAGYTSFALGPSEKVAPEGKGWASAAGAIYSTPLDLIKWDLALMEGRILTPESYRLMTTARTLSNGKMTTYGCGLSVNTQESRIALTHSGAVSGFAAWNGFVPSTKSALVLLANKDGGLGGLPAKLFSLLLREPAPIPSVAGAAASATAEELFTALQNGKVNRARYSEEFNNYLTDAKIKGAADRLKAWGRIEKSEVLRTNERGGLEVTVTRLGFKSGNLTALMYRRPDGVVEQFFVDKE